MKKLLGTVAIGLLVAGIVALGAAIGYFALSGGEPSGQALEVDGSVSAVETADASDRELGVKKPMGDTTADLLDAVSREYAKNADTVGWLRIPGTDINNSVLQSHDNLYYLRRTERKTDNIYGCYFADYACSFGTRDELSQNIVIYGHSDLKDNPNGPRFSQLFRFTEETFARATPTLVFATAAERTVWEVFAVFYTDSKMDYIRASYPPKSFAALIADAKSKSLYRYDVTVGETDHILTLSTCTVKYGTRPDQRFVVMAKLLPIGEEGPTGASLTVQPNPVPPDFS